MKTEHRNCFSLQRKHGIDFMIQIRPKLGYVNGQNGQMYFYKYWVRGLFVPQK
jgi:hypothetical protein